MNSQIKDRIIFLIKQKGINQYQLAKGISAPFNTVNSWCLGKAVPRDGYIKKLSIFFGVSPSWLRYGEQQYAPTLESEAQKLAEEIAAYGDGAIIKARQFLKICLEDKQVSVKKYSKRVA